MRRIIIGGPKTGKTTAANFYARSSDDALEVRHTDALIELGWHEGSDKVAEWIDELNAKSSDWCIEGVAAVRGLRKWLLVHPEGKPCDLIVFMDRPHEELAKGQITMAKSITTIWNGIADDVLGRDVMIDLSPALDIKPEDHAVSEKAAVAA